MTHTHLFFFLIHFPPPRMCTNKFLEPLSNVAPRVGASAKSYVFVKSERQALAMFCEAQSFPIPSHRLVVSQFTRLSSSLKMAISFPPPEKEKQMFPFPSPLISLFFIRSLL